MICNVLQPSFTLCDMVSQTVWPGDCRKKLKIDLYILILLRICLSLLLFILFFFGGGVCSGFFFSSQMYTPFHLYVNLRASSSLKAKVTSCQSRPTGHLLLKAAGARIDFQRKRGEGRGLFEDSKNVQTSMIIFPCRCAGTFLYCQCR